MDKFIKVGSREYERKTNTAAIRGTTVSGPLVGAGVPLIVVGVIYLIGAPRDLEEARYHSVLFLANSIGALTATIGICRSHKWD